MIDICQWRHAIGVWNGVGCCSCGVSTHLGHKWTSSDMKYVLLLVTTCSSIAAIAIVSIMLRLLILCGDIETNPGPPPPTPDAFQIFQSHIGDLIDSITNPIKLANDMWQCCLITRTTQNEVLSTNNSCYDKASQLANTFHTQQRALESTKAKDNLITLCKIIGDLPVTQAILQELGIENCRDLFFEKATEDCGDFIKIMRDKACDESIFQSDWPPKMMGLVDKNYYGRLMLLESAMDTDPQETAWNHTRGKLDKLPVAKSSDKLIGINDLFEIDRQTFILIDGPPGVGKTTLCRKIRQMWALNELKADFKLVLLCSLRRREVVNAHSLNDLMQTAYKHDVSSLCEYFDKYHGAGLLFVFDGWDEFPDDSKHCSFVFDIISKRTLYHSEVIVTSRSYASESLLTSDYSVKHIQVLGFSDNEINAFIKAALKGKEAGELIDELKLRSDIRSICCIPVVCFMVIFIYSKEKQLPTTMTELYTTFVIYTIKREAVKQSNMRLCKSIKNIHDLPSPMNDCLNELCLFSYEMLKRDAPHLVFDSQGLSQLKLSQKNSFLGLMTSFQYYDDDCYQFIHLTIQEYLAALWMAKQDNCHELFNDCFHSPHFHMTLLFFAGLTKLDHPSYRSFFPKPFNGGCKQLSIPSFNQRVLTKLCLNEVDRFGDFMKCFPVQLCYLPFCNSFHTNFDNDPFDGLHSRYPAKQLLHLLYESQNKILCEYYASSISDCSLCYSMKHTTDFDFICLKYFISNSFVNWKHIHFHDHGHISYKSWSFNGDTRSRSTCECLTISLGKITTNDSPVLIQNFPITPSCLFSCCKTICLECFAFHGTKSALNAMNCILEMPCIKNISVCFRHDSRDVEQQENFSSDTITCIKQIAEKSKKLETFQFSMDLNADKLSLSQLWPPVPRTRTDQEFKLICAMLKTILINGVTLSKSIKAVTIRILGKPKLPFPPCYFEDVIENLSYNESLKSIQFIAPNSCFLRPLQINKNNNLSALNICCSDFSSYYDPSAKPSKQSKLNMKNVLEVINSCKHLEFIKIIYSVADHNRYSLINKFLNLKVVDVKFINATQDRLDIILVDFFSKMGNNQHCNIEALKVSVPGIQQWKCNSICGEALQQLLQDNKTLQCLELDFTIPTNCLHYLRAGLQRNTTLKELTVTVFFNIAEDVELGVADDIFFRSSSVTKLIIYMDPFNIIESRVFFDKSAFRSIDDENFDACIDKVFTLYYLGIVPMTLSLLDQNQQLESLMIFFNYPNYGALEFTTRNTQLCKKAEETLELFWKFIRHQTNLKYLAMNDGSKLLMKIMEYILKSTADDLKQETVNSFPQIFLPAKFNY